MTHLLDDREAAVAFFQKHLEVKTGHTPHIWDMDGAVHLSAEENTASPGPTTTTADPRTTLTTAALVIHTSTQPCMR